MYYRDTADAKDVIRLYSRIGERGILENNTRECLSVRFVCERGVKCNLCAQLLTHIFF